LPRPAPGSRPQALIRGRRVPIVAVSLEHLVLDLDGVEDAAVGDEVLLLGRQGEAEIEFGELAAWFGLSGLDTAMALSGRLPSRYLGVEP
jgi:alanine racemase